MATNVKGASGAGCWELGLKLIGDVKGLHVLDIGAGGGEFAKMLSKCGAKPIGCDLVDQWQRSEIPFLKADLDSAWPFASESLDRITIIEALNYVENPSHVFREAYRVLRPGGLLVTTFPNCLCLESRTRFLFNGAYRWFPHPVFVDGSKASYHDLGRDPLRISTAVFFCQCVGFNIRTIIYGNSKLGILSQAIAIPLAAVSKTLNKFRKNKHKRAPNFVMGMDPLLYRNVGLKAQKPIS